MEVKSWNKPILYEYAMTLVTAIFGGGCFFVVVVRAMFLFDLDKILWKRTDNNAMRFIWTTDNSIYHEVVTTEEQKMLVYLATH